MIAFACLCTIRTRVFNFLKLLVDASFTFPYSCVGDKRRKLTNYNRRLWFPQFLCTLPSADVFKGKKHLCVIPAVKPTAFLITTLQKSCLLMSI